MHTKVILLAQGEAKRLEGLIEGPKQFLRVNGETIIDRTIRLLRKFKVEDLTVVAHDSPAWKEFARSREVKLHTMPEVGPSCAASIYRLRDLWSHDHETLFIMADVVFSLVSILRILKPESVVTFVGRDSENLFTHKVHPENFAVKIPADQHELVVETASRLEAAGQAYGCHKLRQVLRDSRRLETGDWTDDIDSEIDLRLLPLFDGFAREELSGVA